MTEFGAAEDTKSDLFSLGETARLADKFQQSWMYWQFKYYEDITTCNYKNIIINIILIF